jgi:broad specificity phosphatase PhoE
MIYLVRHGETRFNVERRLQGSLDSALTPRGEAQAHALGALLRSLIPGAETLPIVSSPQPRAMTTAKAVRAALGFAEPLWIDPRLREFAMGSWEGLTTDEVDRGWSGANATANTRIAWAKHCPDGETLEQARARLADWLADWRDRDVIAVSHGGSGCLLRGLYAGLDDATALGLPIPQDAVFRLANGAIERIDVIETPALPSV